MLTAEQIAALRDYAERLTDPINDYLIRDIAERIAKAGQFTATAQYQIWAAQQMGLSQAEIKKRMKKLLGVSNDEIKKLLTQSAEVGYRFDLKALQTADAIPFAENHVLQEIVSAAVKLAQDDFTNITQTIGMVDPYGRALPLQQAYRNSMDFAFSQVATGAADYNTAVRLAVKNFAEKGIQTIDYQSGIHTSLEAAVRRSVMGGLGLMQEQISKQTHDDLGANGWEISAHAASAPDHEPIQGKQYSDEEYETLNNSLVRRIGTLNCGHAAFPIILGVTPPQYTKEELEKYRLDNERGIDYAGKHYTMYEATQRQRRLEASMRRQKRRILADEATGDQEKKQQDQIKLQVLNQEYRRFSKAAGLRTQDARAEVLGFGGKQGVAAQKTFEKYSEIRYNPNGTVVVTDDWKTRDHPHIPQNYLPNAVIDTLSQRGHQNDRAFYDGNGKQIRQISNGPHGNLKEHPFGMHGEHAHDIVWENGKIVGRPKRELSDRERKENADIL